MELSELDYKKRKQWMDLAFTIAMILAVGALVFLCIWLVRYEQVLTNPLGYNLAKFNISYCSYLDDGNLVIINASIK